MLNYIDSIVSKLRDKLPNCTYDQLRFLSLLVLTTGVNTSRENVHDAWACDAAKMRPNHPSMVPLDQLPEEIQALDDWYVDAIVEVAKEIR